MRTLTAIMLIATTLVLCARVNTTRNALRNVNTNVNVSDVSVMDIEDEAADSAETSVKFKKGAITISGYAKRASDTSESFLITNRTGGRISRVRMQMRYTDTSGNMIHQRDVNVACELGNGETKQVSVSSFDKQRLYYYYAGDKPRKKATPFVVKVRILGYDVPVMSESEN